MGSPDTDTRARRRRALGVTQVVTVFRSWVIQTPPLTVSCSAGSHPMRR